MKKCAVVLLLPTALFPILLLAMATLSRGKHFVFTHNNYTPADETRYREFGNSNDCVYLVYGREIAPTTNTPHLQGYVVFGSRQRIRGVRNRFPGAHIELARGNPEQCKNYSTKDGDFEEFGDFTSITFQGKRNDIEQFKDWLTEQTEYPTDAHIAINFSTLYVKYAKRLLELRDFIFPNPILETAPYRFGWQANLAATLENEPVNDRSIKFYVDPVGGSGKTWFIRKYLSENEDAQFFSVGKRDDIAYAVDVTKRVFLFNIPRDNMRYLQYGILESIKDRLIFSPKYMSITKRLLHKPHVIVFCNEEPDVTQLSADRIVIQRLSEP